MEKEPIKYVTVYRVEHVDCRVRPTHGPCIMDDCDVTFGARPSYGRRGPTPAAEGLDIPCDWDGHYKPEDEVAVAVFDEQFDSWWTDPNQRFMPEGWDVVEYTLPKYAVQRACWQCLIYTHFVMKREVVGTDFWERHGIVPLVPINEGGSGVWLLGDEDELFDDVA